MSTKALQLAVEQRVRKAEGRRQLASAGLLSFGFGLGAMFTVGWFTMNFGPFVFALVLSAFGVRAALRLIDPRTVLEDP